MNTYKRRWYITAMATIYLLICSANCIHLATHLIKAQGSIFELHHLLPFAMTMAAGVYFFKPKTGHLALLGLTSTLLLIIGTTDPKATLFHGVVLLLLLFPLLRLKKDKADSNVAYSEMVR